MTGTDGRVACWKHGETRCAACWPQCSFIERLIERAAHDAGLSTDALPDHIRRRRCGDRVFTFDYLAASVSHAEGE